MQTDKTAPSLDLCYVWEGGVGWGSVRRTGSRFKHSLVNVKAADSTFSRRTHEMRFKIIRIVKKE